MWNKNKKNNTAKGKFEFDLSAERMKDFSAVKAQKSEPSKLAKGLLGLCAFLASANNSTKNNVEFRDGHSGFGYYYNPLDLDLD